MLNVIQSRNTQNAPLNTGDYSKSEYEAMQRATLNLFSKWDIKDADAATILGGMSIKTIRRWKDGDYGRVSRDTADRMSNLLGIHKALRIIFSEPKRGYGWIQTKSGALGDLSALDILRRGGLEDIIRIRRYLDSVRGGW